MKIGPAFETALTDCLVETVPRVYVGRAQPPLPQPTFTGPDNIVEDFIGPQVGTSYVGANEHEKVRKITYQRPAQHVIDLIFGRFDHTRNSILIGGI